ncbi:MAG: hypothetical protein ACXIU8_13435 [Alkalilacustris sp.]
MSSPALSAQHPDDLSARPPAEPKPGAGPAEVFVFGNANMKMTARVLVALVPVLWLAAVGLLVLAVADRAWPLAIVAVGVGLMAPLSGAQARAYRRSIGQRMQVDAAGVSLPAVGVVLPWSGMAGISQRRDLPQRGRWRYVEFLAHPDHPELFDRFEAFNRNLPSALGPLAAGSAGFVVEMLDAPGRDHPRLTAALRRFAPHLMPPDDH